MKKVSVLFLVAIALLGIVTTSCDETEVKLSNLTVSVSVAEKFAGISAVGEYVYLENTGDNSKDSALITELDTVTFMNVAPGKYSVSVSKTLTTAEATAVYVEVMTLNGVEPSVELLAGFDTEVNLVLDGNAASALVIKEFYYSGQNYPIMFKDQYIEIYNNSAETVYADGLYLASIVPKTDGSDKDAVKSTLDFSKNIYADKVTRIPGTGTDYPVKAGESITIALNAMDWSEAESVNLLEADFELYAVEWLESLGRTGSTGTYALDFDNADVTNMDGIYLNIVNYGTFSFYSNAASVAILRLDEEPTKTIVNPESSESKPIYFLELDVNGVIDAIDCLHNAEAGDFKRLPSSIDAGFTYVDGDSFTGLKVMRKVAKEVDGRVIYQDTNNSTEDFVQADCTTGR